MRAKAASVVLLIGLALVSATNDDGVMKEFESGINYDSIKRGRSNRALYVETGQKRLSVGRAADASELPKQAEQENPKGEDTSLGIPDVSSSSLIVNVKKRGPIPPLLDLNFDDEGQRPIKQRRPSQEFKLGQSAHSAPISSPRLKHTPRLLPSSQLSMSPEQANLVRAFGSAEDPGHRHPARQGYRSRQSCTRHPYCQPVKTR